jgi:hypothetical protein
MEETQTTEQVQQHISAAFDSVNLINEEITKEKNNDRIDTIKRNGQHLEIMISKGWFLSGCTEQQIIEINNSITTSNSY